MPLYSTYTNSSRRQSLFFWILCQSFSRQKSMDHSIYGVWNTQQLIRIHRGKKSNRKYTPQPLAIQVLIRYNFFPSAYLPSVTTEFRRSIYKKNISICFQTDWKFRLVFRYVRGNLPHHSWAFLLPSLICWISDDNKKLPKRFLKRFKKRRKVVWKTSPTAYDWTSMKMWYGSIVPYADALTL